MTTRENDLLLQFMEMVFPKDLLRYFELTGFREEAVSEKYRFGVESGELIVSLEERDCSVTLLKVIHIVQTASMRHQKSETSGCHLPAFCLALPHKKRQKIS